MEILQIAGGLVIIILVISVIRLFLSALHLYDN
jgi:hypothetical protein